MTFSTLTSTAKGAELMVTRPGRGNSLGVTIAAELRRHLDNLKACGTPPRLLIIRTEPLAKGERRTWIAGGDLKELAQLDAAGGFAYARIMASVVDDLTQLPYPVVMAIDGAAIGGGAELALAGDLRLAAHGSTFDFRQLQVGLAAGYGSTRRLVDLVGLGHAQGLLYKARSIGTEEALRLGLLHEVSEPEQFEQLITNRVDALLALEPRALAAQKAMFWHSTNSHPGARGAAELELFAALWGNPTHAANLAAVRTTGKAAAGAGVKRG